MDAAGAGDPRRAQRLSTPCCAASSAGTAGIELVFFLLILAGRVFGPGFGFVLGCTSLFASALVTAGRGPVAALPDAASRRGSAWAPGCCRVGCTGRAEIAHAGGYGIVAAYAFGLLMNLSELALHPRHRGARPRGGAVDVVVGAPLAENLQRFAVYTLLTSTGSWDTGRAITTAVALVVLGPAVLTTLRRASRRPSLSTVSRTAVDGGGARAVSEKADQKLVEPSGRSIWTK